MSSSHERRQRFTCSQADIAFLLGVTTRTVQRMSDEDPPIPRNADATYDAVAVVAWHAERQARLAGPGDDAEAGYHEALTRKTAAQADLAELQVAELRADLMRIDDVEAEVRKAVTQVDAALRNIPARYAAELAAGTTKKMRTTQAMRLLDEIVERIRGDLRAFADDDGDDHLASA